MSSIIYNKFGRSELVYVSGKENLLHKNFALIQVNLSTENEQIKNFSFKKTSLKINFFAFKKEMNKNENKELREGFNSLSESVEASLKEFETSLITLQLEYINFIKKVSESYNASIL